MDNLAAQISELLESPDGMDRIRDMASMLMSPESKEPPPPAAPANSMPNIDMDSLRNIASMFMGQQSAAPMTQSAPADGGFSLSPSDIQTMMKVMGALRSGGNDERSRLLLALRPHLSESRQARVDNAVKILRLVSILPLLSESGLNFF